MELQSGQAEVGETRVLRALGARNEAFSGGRFRIIAVDNNRILIDLKIGNLAQRHVDKVGENLSVRRRQRRTVGLLYGFASESGSIPI